MSLFGAVWRVDTKDDGLEYLKIRKKPVLILILQRMNYRYNPRIGS